MRALRGSKRFKTCLALWLTLAVGGCASVADNIALPDTAFSADKGGPISESGYRLRSLPGTDPAPDLLVLLCFSGGGKRSSAFGYGVLKGLRDTVLPGSNTSLLDTVDIISSVSGGSFPAAYYGLYRDRIFTDFEKDFLDKDIETYIWGTYLLPWNLRWLFDPRYGTNDRMAEIYDDLLFHGATYADMARRGRPFISIDATDIDHELVFSFTQDQFDLICSDLTSFPVARAVAASNGFPVLFTPITLKSHRTACGARMPGWIQQDSGDSLSRAGQIAALSRSYLDADATPYVHLMDGGISDNLAIRGLINTVIILTGNEAVNRRYDFSHIRRILLISADGQAANDASSAKNRTMTGLGQIFSAVSGTQIDSYNFETLILARNELEHLRDSIRSQRCAKGPTVDGHACGDVESYLVHLSLADVSDAQTRARLQSIPTGLSISHDDVVQLTAAGQEQVQKSGVLAQFLSSLK